jgi:diadenosine tetraphosphate (Ap4A) HIT family hydrolase
LGVTVNQDARTAEGCLSCRQTAAASLPARDRIVRTENWRAVHAFDSNLPGWLVLVPTRHVTALDELAAAEVVELGPLLRDLSAALRSVVGCAKTYVMLFAEAEGFAHVHFHVVPRMPEQPDDLRGPGIFARLGQPDGVRVSDAEMDRIAEGLRAELPDWQTA